MGILNEMVEELAKYRDIIQQADHLRVKKFSQTFNNDLFEVELKQLDQQIKNCNLTKYPATGGTLPLWGGRALFESNLTENQIVGQIEEARNFQKHLLKKIEEAARSGKDTLF